MLVDLHTHSKYSYDAFPCEVSVLAAAAQDAGIAYLAVTDHKEYFWTRKPMELAIADCLRDVEKANEKYAGSVCVLAGIEIGQIHASPDAIDFLAGYNFDQVIGSLHVHHPTDTDMYFLPYNVMDCDAFLRGYLRELLKMTEYGGFDILAHIDYPLRVMKLPSNAPSFTAYMELIIPVLRETIRRGYALEVNAATLFGWRGEPGPEEFILREYKRLGGERISLGSDAHRAADIGRGMQICTDYVKRLGFNYVTVFEKRQPRLLKL